LNEWLESSPKAIAVFSAAIFAMAASHEWGYFFVVGPQFQTLISAYDYVANGIVYLPVYTLTFACVIFIGFLTRRQVNVPATKFAGFYWWPWYEYWAPAAMTGFCVLTYFIYEPDLFYLFGVLTLAAWIVFLPSATLMKMMAEERLTYSTKAAAGLIPVAIVAMFGVGLLEARYDLRDPGSLHTVVFKETSGVPRKDDLQATFLRSFDKGILIHDSTKKRVEYIRWDDIVVIRRAAPAQNSASFGCNRFGWRCR